MLTQTFVQACEIGQYEGYQDDPDIVQLSGRQGHASRCPTFAVAVMYLDNERWSYAAACVGARCLAYQPAD